MTDENDFPDAGRLRPGAVLGAIAHAIAVAQYPDISNEQSWDGDNYSVQDSAGSRGTVAFSGDDFVGVFFDDDSPRNPFRPGAAYDLESFFEGMPDELRPLAHEEALQYVLQEFEGEARPVITSAFWSRGGGRLAAAEPWEQVFDNGARLVRLQLLGPDEGLAGWREQYELTDDQAALARSLFERRMASPGEPLTLTEQERDLLGASDDEGLEECRESFAEIGISLP